jgi:exodeoxyribonuclease VII small subunit
MSTASESSLGDFEKSLEQLEEIVSKMEQGQLSLEQSLSAFEEGVKLTRSCQDSLKSAEQRVSQLIQEGERLAEKPLNNTNTP